MMTSCRRVVTGLAVVAALALPAPVATASATGTADPGPTSWSMVPADADGPDGRRSIDVRVEPGDETTEHVELTNSSDHEVTFDLAAADGYLTAAGSYDLRPSDAEPTGGGAWIDVEGPVTLGAGETTVLPFTVTVPRGATPGDHPAGVASSVTTRGDTVTVENRVGVRVDVHVPGTATAAVDVSDTSARFTAPWTPFQPGTFEVSADVRNTGNVTVDTTSVITSEGPGGASATTSGAAHGPALIPGSAVRVTNVTDGVWPLGRVTAELTVTPAATDGTLDVEAAPQTVVVSAWALPWPQVLLALLVTAAVLGVRAARAARRERLQRMLAEARAAGAAAERARDLAGPLT